MACGLVTLWRSRFRRDLGPAVVRRTVVNKDQFVARARLFQMTSHRCKKTRDLSAFAKNRNNDRDQRQFMRFGRFHKQQQWWLAPMFECEQASVAGLSQI